MIAGLALTLFFARVPARREGATDERRRCAAPLAQSRPGAVPGRPRGPVQGVSTTLPTFCRRRIRRWAAAASVKA